MQVTKTYAFKLTDNEAHDLKRILECAIVLLGANGYDQKETLACGHVDVDDKERREELIRLCYHIQKQMEKV